MKRTVFLLLMLALFLVSFRLLAMSSTGFQLDWYTPLTTNGGGEAVSPSFAINISVGQTASSVSVSSSYVASLGYWGGAAQVFTVRLPVIMK